VRPGSRPTARSRTRIPALGAILVALSSATAGLACAASPPAPPSARAGDPAAPRLAPTKASLADPAHVHVLMINGGGRPAINYQSHLAHLRELYAVLLERGVSPEHVSILSADGADPAPDLASREPQPEPDFWRLEGTRLEEPLASPLVLVSSTLDGARLGRASKANLARWFQDQGARLGRGDTLLLYVTDHGTRHGDDSMDNRITLWGGSVSARELGELIGQLHPSVRVVSVMSQCYSGGFAYLAWTRLLDAEPSGNACGYFSSTADRPAYGCYPESLGKDSTGHGFSFARTLARTGSLSQTHAEVVAADVTPDVPLRTSDIYHEKILRDAARARGVPLTALADALLARALGGDPGEGAEIATLDRLALAFGLPSPRALDALDALIVKLRAQGAALSTFAEAWSAALADENRANLERFLATHSAFRDRLSPPALRRLTPAAARALTEALLAELAPFTEADAEQSGQLALLRSHSERLGAAAYRAEVRLGIALRMQALLLTIAGRAYLAEGAPAAQVRAGAALAACEELTLPGPRRPPDPPTTAAVYPPFADDMALADRLRPSWAGIGFTEPSVEMQKGFGLSAGAALITAVTPGSPAQAAGLTRGDIVLGAPGHPFKHPGQIRAFILRSPSNTKTFLEVLRGPTRRQVTLVPVPVPIRR
jgi:hypothetical protein